MEKIFKPQSGWLMLLFSLVLSGFAAYDFAEMQMFWPGVIAALLSVLILTGFLAIEPNSTRVLILFGDYIGTVKQSGFYWANPFFLKRKITQRAHNLDIKPLKVNDLHGNPIMIGSVVVWKVEDTFRAAFDVDHYEKFVETQIESALRKLAGMYSYDNFEDESAGLTLRSSSDEVNNMLEKEIAERVEIAGVKVIEARISHLAYSTEIAGAMLQRQQATAIIAARSKIVEGAVGMVEMALDHLSRKDIVHLDEEKKAAMVSNLMVVLCSDKSTTPIVNTGTLYQ